MDGKEVFLTFASQLSKMPLQEELEIQGNGLFRYRGTLPLIILVIGMAVFAYYVYVGQTINDHMWNESYKFLCLAVCFAGLIVRILTVGYTPVNTSGRNTGGQIADVLNTTGIYSTVRHPLYVGNFLMWLGPAMLTQNVWFVIAFIFLYWVYYERIMFAEEQFLRKKFGEEYINWASTIPAFLPSFKRFVKNKLSFSWRKVLKQEKNGFFAIFAIFFFFDAIEDYIKTQNIELIGNYWLYLFVISGLFYLVIKILKNNTSLLRAPGR